jgi:hypothetical protein
MFRSSARSSGYLPLCDYCDLGRAGFDAGAPVAVFNFDEALKFSLKRVSARFADAPSSISKSIVSLADHLMPMEASQSRHLHPRGECSALSPSLPTSIGWGFSRYPSRLSRVSRLAVVYRPGSNFTLRLGESLDPLNKTVQSFLEQAQARFLQQTGDPAAAAQQLAWQALENLRHQQASALAYFDCFWLFAVVILAVTFFVLLMKRSVAEKGACIGGE